MRRGRNYLLLVVTMALWSSNLLMGKAVLGQIDPVQLTWLRWCFSVPPLVLFAVRLDGNRWRDALRQWPQQLLASGLGILGYPLLAYLALSFTSSLDVSIVNALNPAFLAVGAALLARERVGVRTIVGLVVSILGVLVVVTRGELTAIASLRPNPGELIMLVAITLWTAYSLYARRLAAPPSTSTAFQGIVGAVVLTPFALIGAGTEGPALRPLHLDGWGWLFIVLIAVLPSAAGFVFWNLAVKGLGGGTSAVFLSLLPAFTAVGSLALGQPVTLAQWLGGAIVVAGVLWAIAPRPRASARRPPRPARR